VRRLTSTTLRALDFELLHATDGQQALFVLE